MNTSPCKRMILSLFFCLGVGSFGTIVQANSTTANQATGVTVQECKKAHGIAKHIDSLIRKSFTSQDPRHIVAAQTYLNKLTFPRGKIGELLTRIKVSLTTLIQSMKLAKQYKLLETTKIENLLTNAFDKFGSDIRAAACQVRTLGNEPEISELANFLDELPTNANNTFLAIGYLAKKKFGTKIWWGKY